MPEQPNRAIKRRVSIQARQLLVLGYKAAGSSDRDIVDKIKDDHGVTVSRQTVNSDWHQALFDLTELMKPKAEELRTLHIVRLEAMLEAIWPKVLKGDLPAVKTGLYILVQIKNVQGLDKQAVLVYERVESVSVYADDADYDWSKVPDSELFNLVDIIIAARRDPNEPRAITEGEEESSV